MSVETTVRVWRARRQRRREAKAEIRGFVSVYDRQKKNRLSQSLLALSFVATLVGASLALVGSLVGFILVVAGVPATVAIAVWIFRNWDY